MNQKMAYRVPFILVLLALMHQLPVKAQLCATPAVPPFTTGELNITASSTGSVDVFFDPYTSCGSYTTPANSVWLGPGGSFSYFISFSLPVNDVTVIINAAGQTQDENFIFTTNGGIPAINMISGCYSSVSGNQILSGLNADAASLGGGGQFVISASQPYTQMTITGDGGSAGSLFALCADGLIAQYPDPCAPFTQTDGLTLPNVITPNGDLVNDEWVPADGYTDCFDYECQFFNRWGELVYSHSSTGIPFSGKDANGKELSEGNYLYVFHSQGKDWHGFVTLIR